MQYIDGAVAVGGAVEAGGDGDLAARPIAGAIQRQRIRIAPAELLVAACPIDHAGPEAVEVLVVEIAPAIGRIKPDEKCAPRADELRCQQHVWAELVAHARIAVPRQNRSAGLGARHWEMP